MLSRMFQRIEANRIQLTWNILNFSPIKPILWIARFFRMWLFLLMHFSQWSFQNLSPIDSIYLQNGSVFVVLNLQTHSLIKDGFLFFSSQNVFFFLHLFALILKILIELLIFDCFDGLTMINLGKKNNTLLHLLSHFFFMSGYFFPLFCFCALDFYQDP